MTHIPSHDGSTGKIRPSCACTTIYMSISNTFLFPCCIALIMAIPANQALLNMNADLFNFLTQSLNFTHALCNCLSHDGYNNTIDFVDWTYAEISKYCEVKSTKSIARGGCNWPERKKKDLQGFAFYVSMSLSALWKEFK
jgi:hypothetical protein